MAGRNDNWVRRLIRKLKRDEVVEEADVSGGPENTLNVRSVTHLKEGVSPQTVKQVRTPHSLGNQTWGVSSWNNSIKTSQYTWWNFLLLNLFQQAIIPANAYFILMVILQLIPAISDSSGFPTYLPPLAFVMAVTMIKDLWEDIKRHRSDKDENTRRTQILTSNGEWKVAQWRNIKPGDIIKVEADEIFPADLLMICCSDEFGIAYVETVQLDGETNMKTKTAVPALNDLYSNNVSALANAKIEVTYGAPSAKLYSFNGVLEVHDQDYDYLAANKILKSLSKSRSIFGPPVAQEFRQSLQLSKLSVRTTSMATPTGPSRTPEIDSKTTYVLGMPQFMWRGATLINTQWLAGIVVYTGHETRIFKNTRSRGTKYSGLMKSYNYNAITLLAMQLCLCILAGGLYVVDVTRVQSKSWYLAPESEREFQTGFGRAFAFALTFGRYILLLSYFIPITLLVQIEIARWFHGFFIAADNEAMSRVTKTKPAVSTLSVLEDLGSITHVFSDKTGTLTQNIMQLKSFEINGDVFGFDEESTDEGDVGQEDSDDNFHAPKAGTAPVPPTRDVDVMGLATTSPEVVSEVEAAEDRWLHLQTLVHDGTPIENITTKELVPSRSLPLSVVPTTIRRNPNRFVDFDASDARKYLLTRSQNATRRSARDFLLILSVCHSVLPKTSVNVERVCEPESVHVPLPQSPRDGLKQTYYIPNVSPAHSSSLSSVGGPFSPLGSPTTTTPAKLESSNSASVATSVSPLTKATCAPQSSLGSSGDRDGHMDFLDDRPQNVKNISPELLSSHPISSVASSRDMSPECTTSANPEPVHFLTQSSHRSIASPRQDTPPLVEAGSSSMHWSTAIIAADSQSMSGPSHTNANLEPTSHVERKSASHKHHHHHHQNLQEPEGGQSEAQKPKQPLVFARLWTAELPTKPAKRTPIRIKDTRRYADAIVEETNAKKFTNETQHTAPPPPPNMSLNTILETADLAPGVKIAAAKWNASLAASFDASSPDELALVAGAKHMGIEFLRRPDLNSIEIGILNENSERLFMEESDRRWINEKRQMRVAGDAIIIPTYTYEILDCLDFDNVRKRMSVIMRDRDGRIKLLTKGADSSMLSVAARGQQKHLKELENALADFAREGLRTLVLGLRVLTDDEFQSWKEKVDQLRSTGTDDVEQYCECFCQIEKDLTLVGCTAIDDKLQDEVPQTIEALKDAGIRVWILTGDKVETAISIGHSANLLTDTTYNAIIDGGTVEEVREQMYKYMAFVVGGQLAKEAFDQILLQQSASALTETTPGGDGDGGDDTPVRGGCFRQMKVCCVRGDSVMQERRRKRRTGTQKKTVAMDLEDFVNVITFNAKHKVVAPVDGRTAPKELTPEELEQLIAVYVEKFEPADDKKKGWDIGKRLGGMVGVSKKEDTLSVTKSSPKGLVSGPVEPPTPESVEQYNSVAITITGDALNHALSTDETRKYFYGLAHLCSTVIACRVTPKQKAEVVRQCGRCTPTSSFTSLGIGDGANDVGMILTAHVGVGLFGKEGSQAARSADLAIGEFKILRNLLFFHGHQILRRHAIMVYQTIFKNIMFAMATYLCGIFSGFSAADPYNAYLKQFYNLLYTPWCIMAVAVFDRALPYDVLYKTASLYPIAMRPDGTQYFGARWFGSWFAFGLFAAVVVTFFPYAVIALGVVESDNGMTVFDWSSYGHSVFVLVVIIACAVSIPFTHTVFWFTPLAFVLSWGGLYLCWVVVSYPNLLGGSELEGSFLILNRSPLYQFTMLVAASVPLLLLFIWWKYKITFHPTPQVIIRERIKKGVFDVVVAPRKRGELAVVVPKALQRESWKGFAFSPSETRYSLRRKTLSMQRMSQILEDEVISHSAA